MLDFDVKALNSTAVITSWASVNSSYVDHYTVYYTNNSVEGIGQIQNTEVMMAMFPAGSSSGVIGGLEVGQTYLFSLTVTYDIGGLMYEGDKTDHFQFGTCLLHYSIEYLVQ